MTNEELIDGFNRTIDVWINALGTYSLQKLVIKPDLDSWSLGQVYMHVLDETRYFMEQIEDCLERKETGDGQMTSEASTLFFNNSFPDERIVGDPFNSEKVQQPSSISQLIDEMQELKLEMNSIWKEIIKRPKSGKAMHPGLGYFTATEWVQYSEMHLRHHLRQKGRIDEFLRLAKV